MSAEQKPDYTTKPCIQLCSRAALDKFLEAYWPELLRQLNEHQALTETNARQREALETLKLKLKRMQARSLQVRCYQISELHNIAEAALTSARSTGDV